MDPWSDAPRDILQIIAEKINHHSDFLHFGAVCKRWRYVYMENRHCLPYKLPMRLCHPRQLSVPLLLRSHKEDADSHEFICLSDEKVYDGFFLPEAINKWICGSSFGWLVTVDIGGEEIHLLNPFTRAQIRLPPLSSFRSINKIDDDEPIDYRYIRKAIISADPAIHSSDYVVLAITGNAEVLSYCRVGDTKWTNIKESPLYIMDVIYHDGRFYAIDQNTIVVAFDSFSPDAVATIIIGNIHEVMKNGEDFMPNYLVYSSGVLLKVIKILDCQTFKTIKFNVYMLQKSESPIYRKVGYGNLSQVIHAQEEIFYKWVKLESLGDEMLLLGGNSSMSLPAHLFPNFKSNCIYFTDDFVEKCCENPHGKPDMVDPETGIFDMHDGSIQSCCLNGPISFIPSIWVIPNVW